jgi:pyridoxine 5-phosphate synthase
MACTAEMVEIALQVLPEQVTLVPERREEITTEGGLDLSANPGAIESVLRRLRDAGIRTSLFIAPDLPTVHRSAELGTHAIELHTGAYANNIESRQPLVDLQSSASVGASRGLAVHAGHGLTTDNVGPVAAISEIEELNIGHSVVSRALFVGLAGAVTELRAAIDLAAMDLAYRQHNHGEGA